MLKVGWTDQSVRFLRDIQELGKLKYFGDRVRANNLQILQYSVNKDDTSAMTSRLGSSLVNRMHQRLIST